MIKIRPYTDYVGICEFIEKEKARMARAQASSKIYVAVVVKSNLWSMSGRPKGDFASFINKQKSAAIESARLAKEGWERTGNGPYRILVGQLNEEVLTPMKYELAPLVEV